MINIFSNAQAALFNEFLLELDITVAPELMPEIMAIDAQKCVQAEIKGNNFMEISSVVIGVFARMKTYNTDPSIFTTPENEKFEPILVAVRDGITKEYYRNAHVTFAGAAKNIIQRLKELNEYPDESKSYNTEDKEIVSALIVGGALFASTVLISRELDEKDLRHEMHMGSKDLESLKAEIKSVVSELREFKAEGEVPPA